jgi:hypothetical protein
MSFYTFDELKQLEPTRLNILATQQDELYLTENERNDVAFLQSVHRLVDMAHADAPDVRQAFAALRQEVTQQHRQGQVARNWRIAEYALWCVSAVATTVTALATHDTQSATIILGGSVTLSMTSWAIGKACEVPPSAYSRLNGVAHSPRLAHLDAVMREILGSNMVGTRDEVQGPNHNGPAALAPRQA